MMRLDRPMHPAVMGAVIEMAIIMGGSYGGVQKQDVLRISINDDGTFDITDFALPSEHDKVRRNVPQEDVPQWILESISMLRIAEINSLVEGLGFKLDDRLYFIQDKRGQAHEGSA
jgi:hypothetical protein